MRIWRREKYFVIVFLSGRICLPSTSLPSRTSNAALSVRKVRGKKSILNGSGVHDVGVGTIKIGRKPLRVRSAKRVHQTVAVGLQTISVLASSKRLAGSKRNEFQSREILYPVFFHFMRIRRIVVG